MSQLVATLQIEEKGFLYGNFRLLTEIYSRSGHEEKETFKSAKH